MSGERKKPGMAFWATVVVAVVILYPLAYGPWWYARGKWGSEALVVRISRPLFAPIDYGLQNGPDILMNPYGRYCLWCFSNGIFSKNP